MNWDKAITFAAIFGAIVITTIAMFVYKAEGKEITAQAITGLLGFAGGVGTTAGFNYIMAKKEGE